ncbi:MAG TPA: S8 family serine peptidase [Blastocatellia bacterium]|nr:S8 family serine peptidase [Blastocatellia bacterium]
MNDDYKGRAEELDDDEEFSLENRNRPSCPICQRSVSPVELLDADAVSDATLALVIANSPGWKPQSGICLRCAERFAEAQERLKIRYPSFGHREYKILPTPIRLGASNQYSGKGVTIAFLDSGFYAHPDLVEPSNRILKYVDITNPRSRDDSLHAPDVSSWHGMMTSVVACGNGYLSNGLYRGIASDATLVLVKCGSARRIVHDDIRRGIDWVIKNRDRYGIRIVNVSCGGDYEAPYLHDALCQAAERATRAGILVCAAVGNAGHADEHEVLPPASSPSVLTVGGLDDKNRLEFSEYDMYHSSYGPTIDGLQKPEVIAPGIWVAAPILPGTPTSAQAQLLSLLASTPDASLHEIIAANPEVDEDLDAALGLDAYLIRHLVEIKMRDHAVISGSYKHVDGTSFSSPIVASIAAQMLEANPALQPHDVKSILVKTATRLPHVPVDRQGWGVVSPKKAVLRAIRTHQLTEATPSA